MNRVQVVERAMTDTEYARMNAGFDENTIEHGNPIQVSERFGFVALDGETFIGCSSGLAYRNGDVYNGWFYLTDLYVEKSYRKQGLGRELLRLLEERVVSLGVRHFWTDTAGYEAPGFYLKQGYMIVFEQENWYATGHARILLHKTMPGV